MNLATNSEQGKKILQGIPVIGKANGRRHINAPTICLVR